MDSGIHQGVKPENWVPITTSYRQDGREKIMAKDFLMGIDIGTTGAKVALFDVTGRTIASAGKEYPTAHPHPKHAEQDPEDWWKAIKESVQQVLSIGNIASQNIAAISISSMTITVLPLAKDGKPLYPAIIWTDTRSEEQCAWIKEKVGEELIANITCNQIAPLYASGKILWLKQNKPKIFDQTYKFLQANSYINLKLTGEFTMDLSNIVLTGLGDAKQKKWSTNLCEIIGISLEKLPKIYNSTQVIGKVTRKAAKETGLAEGTPVIAGANDVNAAALAAGVVRPGQVFVDVGHATSLGVCVDQALYHPNLILSDSVFPNLWFTGGIASYTGASVRWFRDTFGMPEVQAACLLNCDPFDLMNLEVEKTGPGAGNLIFLPHLGGFSTPLGNPNAKGLFFGLSLNTTRSHIIRAIFEGSAYSLHYNIQKVISAGINVSEKVRITGGGSKSKVWNQIRADITNRVFLLPQNPTGSVLGSAILAGVGAGLYPDIREAVKSIVKEEMKFEPRFEYHQKYKELFDIYCNVYEKLEEEFNQLARVEMQ